jgi:hypothetical protein
LEDDLAVKMVKYGEPGVTPLILNNGTIMIELLNSEEIISIITKKTKEFGFKILGA